MRWVLMLFVILAAVMGGEAREVVVSGREVVSERVGWESRCLDPRGDADRAGELAAGEELAAWRGEPVAVLADLAEADTASDD